MKKLVLIGGGGHCKSVLDAAFAMDKFDEIVITDASITPGSKILGCEVVGTDGLLKKLKSKGFDYAFITVGCIRSSSLRESLVSKAKKIGFIFPVIIDPSAIVSQSAKIGSGTFVGKKAVVNADCVIGEHCIINTGAIIEHECYVGDFCHISVGSILCGNVKVGCNSFVGAGSTIVQSVKIGNRSVIGANSTVLVNVRDNQTVYHIVNTPPRKLVRLTCLSFPIHKVSIINNFQAVL